MFDLGFQELILIFIVALLVFGPKKLPEVGRSLGRGVAELRRAMRGVTETMQEEERNLKDQLPDVRKPIDDLVRSVKDAENSVLAGVKDAYSPPGDGSSASLAGDRSNSGERDAR